MTYLKIITESPSAQVLIKKVNDILKTENLSVIDPYISLLNLKKNIQNQKAKKITYFDDAVFRLNEITNFSPSEQAS